MTTSNLTVAAIMSPDPTTIDRSDPLSEAYQLLQDAPFHHLIVTDHDEPIGMLSSSDILRLVYDVDGTSDRALRTYMDHQFTIEDAMTTGLRTVGIKATVREAAKILSEGTFHSVVVLDEAKKLAGIVTTTDLARYVAKGKV
ncbi:MAG: CBS domain-containing protein [Acidimicrobiales bacterium]|nr:CBS domain-containing protein [Acidimicrobiales bacterium]